MCWVHTRRHMTLKQLRYGKRLGDKYLSQPDVNTRFRDEMPRNNLTKDYANKKLSVTFFKRSFYLTCFLLTLYVFNFVNIKILPIIHILLNYGRFKIAVNQIHDLRKSHIFYLKKICKINFKNNILYIVKY